MNIEKSVDELLTQKSKPKKKKARIRTKLGRKSILGLLAVFVAGTLIASAGLLTYYGTVETTANVQQSVVLWHDDAWQNYDTPITETLAVTGGSCTSFNQWIKNRAEVAAPIGITTSIKAYGKGTAGVTVSYLTPVEYTFSQTIAVSDGTVGNLEVTVAEDGNWMVWTFDFPVEQFTGNGNLNVGLIIANDGIGKGPAFQIHNNDGSDSSYLFGDWLYSPWGPTTGDGWMGWHSSDTNTPVGDLSWVEAIGQRNTPWQGIVSGDGVMEIRILKSVLGDTFHWAASPTVGSGFSAPAYDVTMQIPTDFSWGVPIVDMVIPNYIEANLMEELTNPFTLQPGEELPFIIRYCFDLEIIPGQYDITTQFVPN